MRSKRLKNVNRRIAQAPYKALGEKLEHSQTIEDRLVQDSNQDKTFTRQTFRTEDVQRPCQELNSFLNEGGYRMFSVQNASLSAHSV